MPSTRLILRLAQGCALRVAYRDVVATCVAGRAARFRRSRDRFHFGTLATATPARTLAIPVRTIAVTVSPRNARPRASATIGEISVVRLTIVASSFLIT